MILLYVGAGSIPMLPPVLAHGALSLTQGQPRPVLSLWLTVVDGKVVRGHPPLPPLPFARRLLHNMRAGSACVRICKHAVAQLCLRLTARSGRRLGARGLRDAWVG